MKKIVFYDFETSGLSSAYDSIIQAAAILTDEEFNILDQFNFRGTIQTNKGLKNKRLLKCLKNYFFQYLL